MTIRSSTLSICAIVAAAAAVPSAQAGVPLQDLIILDLSVSNQLTVTATTGLSVSTWTGSDGIGIYLGNFFTANGTFFDQLSATGSTFVHVGGTASTSMGLYRDDSTETGLNLYAWAIGTSATFNAGTQAFTGTVTFSLSAGIYTQLLGGNTSGIIYFPADDATDLNSSHILGTYRVIPTPGAAAVLGLGGLASLRRRRR